MARSLGSVPPLNHLGLSEEGLLSVTNNHVTKFQSFPIKL